MKWTKCCQAWGIVVNMPIEGVDGVVMMMINQVIKQRNALMYATLGVMLLTLFQSLPASAENGHEKNKFQVFTSGASGFDTNTHYYDDGSKVVVIDTQFMPKLTEEMIRKVTSSGSSAIATLVVTHPNPDKFNGVQYMKKVGAQAISSDRVRRMIPRVHSYKKKFWVEGVGEIKEEDYPDQAVMDKGFKGESYRILLSNGNSLTLFALKNTGMSGAHVVVRDDQTGDLVVGDLVHTNVHAWLEGELRGDVPELSIEGWKKSLDEVAALSAGYRSPVLYPGRGEPELVSVAIRKQKHYLNVVSSLVDNFYRNHSDCSLAGGGESVKSDINEIKKKIVDRFPDYKHEYMLQYSLQGLINSKKRSVCKQRDANKSGNWKRSGIEVSRVYNAPALKLWGVIKDFCSIQNWQSEVESCSVDRKGPSLRRSLVMLNKTIFVEDLVNFSEIDYEFEYVIKKGPLPVNNYKARMKVIPVGGGESMLVWKSGYTPLQADDEAIKKDLLSLFERGLDGVGRLL